MRLDEKQTEHAPRSFDVLSKWRLVGAYWTAQAMFVSAAVPLLAWQADTVNGKSGHPWGSLDWDRLRQICSAWEVWATVVAVVVGLMVLQTVIVWPVRRPRYRTEKGWPLRLSIGVGALAGAALATGIGFAVGTAIEMYGSTAEHDTFKMLRVCLWIWIGGSYILGAVLMHRFCSRGLKSGKRHEALLGRIAATLFVGTLVEAAAIMPIDVMYRRKQDCYCFAGTFGAYALLLAAGLLTLGPAILLPVLSRRRKRWYGSHCDCCGYDMTGFIGASRVIDRCPECGAGWKPP